MAASSSSIGAGFQNTYPGLDCDDGSKRREPSDAPSPFVRGNSQAWMLLLEPAASVKPNVSHTTLGGCTLCALRVLIGTLQAAEHFVSAAKGRQARSGGRCTAEDPDLQYYDFGWTHMLPMRWHAFDALTTS